jgi:hypothetical protein
LAFSLCEELSSGDWIVSDESAWDAQTGACCQTELSLFVFRVVLALKVVYPARVVQRVEKTFERGGRLTDAH